MMITMTMTTMNDFWSDDNQTFMWQTAHWSVCARVCVCACVIYAEQWYCCLNEYIYMHYTNNTHSPVHAYIHVIYIVLTQNKQWYPVSHHLPLYDHPTTITVYVYRKKIALCRLAGSEREKSYQNK